MPTACDLCNPNYVTPIWLRDALGGSFKGSNPFEGEWHCVEQPFVMRVADRVDPIYKTRWLVGAGNGWRLQGQFGGDAAAGYLIGPDNRPMCATFRPGTGGRLLIGLGDCTGAPTLTLTLLPTAGPAMAHYKPLVASVSGIGAQWWIVGGLAAAGLAFVGWRIWKKRRA